MIHFTCGCGETYSSIPAHAVLSKDLGPGNEGFMWNCKCGSTLFAPAELCREAECIIAWVLDEPVYQRAVSAGDDYTVCVGCYCKMVERGFRLSNKKLKRAR